MKKALLSALCLLCNFFLLAQTITITSPTGGEVWEGCTNQNITWTDAGTSNFYSIDYSVNNGATWTSIATFYNTTSGSYSWTLPNVQSTQALIRVQDSNNQLVEDISVPFTIIAPLIVLAPNGSEVIEGGTNYQIQWLDYATSNYFDIDYSNDGGNTWNLIENNYYSTSNTYNWSVPNDPTTSALIRIKDDNASCKSDLSDQLFEITPATSSITVTTPNGGQTYYPGESRTIYWTSEFVTSNQIQIEYSLDNGLNWIILVAVTSNDGSYNWIVPNSYTEEALIRITDLVNPSTFDVSDLPFEIVSPFIEIYNPSGGELVDECSQMNIQWSHNGLSSDLFNIYASNDGGVVWELLAANINEPSHTSANYVWDYLEESPSWQVKVESVSEPMFYDESLSFEVLDNQSIILNNPNGGGVYTVGDLVPITWTDVSLTYFNIYYSIDNGDSWSTIDIQDSGNSFNWIVPNTPSEECLIYIRDYYDSCKRDYSDGVFTIVQPDPMVTSPNSALVYYPHENRSISWTDEFYNDDFVVIDVSYDNGLTWNNLINATNNDGSFSWTIPSIITTEGLIRVTSLNDGAVTDISDVPFEIAAPFIEIYNPSGGEMIDECSQMNIQWSHEGLISDLFNVYASNDGGLVWDLIASNISEPSNSSANYVWQEPNESTNWMVKVESASEPEFYDESASFESLDNQSIILNNPNGGETYTVGDVVTITWTDVSLTYFNIYYSIDNGSTWSTIDIQDTGNAFTWTVPNTPSEECLIYIRDYYDSCKRDYSDAVFTIVQPSPMVTSPNSAFVYYPHESRSISWTDEFYNTDFVKIDVSYDNGLTWNNLTNATNNDGTFSWIIPSIITTEGLVRVTSLSDETVTDVSDVPFEIASPFIEIYNPSGGEVVDECSQINIQWSHDGLVSDLFNVYASNDGGMVWEQIATNISEPSHSSANYIWQEPDESTSWIIKVESASESEYYDESASFESSDNQSIILNNPNGGEAFSVGEVVTISWTDVSLTYFNIYYSIDNGESWSTIDIQDTGNSFNWIVPNTPSDECLIYIRDYYNSCQRDYSNGVFTIIQPEPMVTSPNAAFVYYPHENRSISWTDEFYNDDFVVIDVSYDNGLTWNNLINATNNDGSFSWTIPSIFTTEGLIRVTSLNDEAVTDVSDVPFEIASPFIEIYNPSGGEMIDECSQMNIQWSHEGLISDLFNVYASNDGGLVWDLIASNISEPSNSSANYAWQEPNESTNWMVKVESASEPEFYDESASFESVDNQSIILNNPNGGEAYTVGDVVTITWTDVSLTYFNIYYSINNGSSWSTIDIQDTGNSFNWIVPNTPSEECLIYIRDYYDSCKRDYSDAVFTIVQPEPMVTSPNAAFVYYPHESRSISWTDEFYNTDFVKIDVSYDNGLTWNSLTNATNNDGTFSWIIPSIITTEGLVRVTSLSDETVTDVSDVPFEIASPFIEIYNPSGGEMIDECSQINIQWSHNGLNSDLFNVYTSNDGGTVWELIASNINEPSHTSANYIWSQPEESTNWMVKVESADETEFYDESASFESVNNLSVILNNPNGGEVLTVGEVVTITWTDISLTYFNIYYSVNNGVTWSTIDIQDSGNSFNWVVPNTPSEECLIYIRDYYNSCQRDYSDEVFTIVQPEAVVISPSNENTSMYSLTNYNITWTDEYFNSSFVTIEYSANNALDWEILVNATNNDGSYSWEVPENLTQEGLVRVSSIDDPTIVDVSDFPFEIKPPVLITSPNGDNGIQDWRVCTETTITWETGGTSNYFDLFYSLNNGIDWVQLVDNFYSSGSDHQYDWTMPNNPTPGALVRVQDRYSDELVDYSDETFTIAPAITVTAPNGNEMLTSGDVLTISWLNDGATDSYNIDYSTNNGVTWNNIVFNEFISSQSYDWVIPSLLSEEYLIRVQDNIDNCKSDVSDNTFTVSAIASSTIDVTSPNDGAFFDGCEQQLITWNSLNTSDYYNLEYSLNGGVDWISIVSDHYSTSGGYIWSVPNEASNNTVIRVSDANAPGINDVIDTPIVLISAFADAGPDITICDGEFGVLQGSGGITYSWSPTTDLTSPLNQITNASPPETMVYTLTTTDEHGCQASDEVTVIVDNGLCEVSGCLDPNAYNYNPLATVDNGFCLYTEGSGSDTCSGDIDGDGAVGASDLLAMLASFGNECE